MNLHTNQDALPKGRQPLKPTVAPPSPPRRSALAIAMLLGAVPLVSRAQSPLPDGFNPGSLGITIHSLALQGDGKILFGGYPLMGGLSGYRLHKDGTVDHTSFLNAYPSQQKVVSSLVLQADGKILVGGSFTTLGGQARNRLCRLHPNGTVDAAFNPGASGTLGGLAQPYVSTLCLQADGKILVGGYFATLGGQPRSTLGRLHSDGTVDDTFNPGVSGGLDLWYCNAPAVTTLCLQPDGKILVGGIFTALGGQQRSHLGRLHPDGTLDATFNPGAITAAVEDIYACPPVSTVCVQADGKILVGGGFNTLGGEPHDGIGRLHPDGTIDSTFDPESWGCPDYDFPEIFYSPHFKSLALQTDGKVLVGGVFHGLERQPRSYFGRLHADGTLDAAFDPRANGVVHSLALQADGKILAGGDFTRLGGQPRQGLGRLNNTSPATQALSHDGSTITWMRGGTSPEVWRATFESSADGLKWTFLGAGIRIPGGWELAGVSVSPEAILRARGFVAGGSNSSGWFAETTWSAPPVVIGLDLVGDGVDITVSSVAGRFYTLQTTATLDAWADVPGAVAVAGTGAALVLHHADPVAGRNFYRVVVRW